MQRDVKTGKALRAWMNANNMTSFALADRIGRSPAFIEHMVTGVFSERGIAHVEQKLGIQLRQKNVLSIRAAEDLGGYLLEDYEGYEGNYILYQAAECGIKVDISHIEIRWDSSRPGLVARAKIDSVEHKAYVSIPKFSSHLIMTSSPGGWSRLMIVSFPNEEFKLFGSLFCISLLDNQLAPIFSPVVLRRQKSGELLPQGLVANDHPFFGEMKQDLQKANNRKHILSWKE